MPKILLVDLAFVGTHGGGHSEAYFMKILSTLNHHDFMVYAYCGNNKLLRENILKESLKKCEIIDELKIGLLDKIIINLFLFADKIFYNIIGIKYIRFSSLIKLIIVKMLINGLDKEIPVFFAHTDSMMPAVPTLISQLFMPSRWVGLCVLPSYQLKLYAGLETSRIRFNGEKNFSLPSCRGIMVLHPLYQRFFSKRIRGLNCLYLPELVEFDNKSELKTIINIELLQKIREQATGRKIISILGNLTPRKNLPLFLESVSKLNSMKYFVIVLGKLKTQKDNFLNQKIINIEQYKHRLVENSYIDTNYYIPNETEFSALVDLSDLVFLHYKNHPFSSNMLTRVIAHRKPVIVNKGYLMEKIIKQYNWKMAIENNPEKIAKAIEELLDNGFTVNESGYSSFMQDHSSKRFQETILKACDLLLQE